MLPRITPEFHLKDDYFVYLIELKKNSFSGDICTDYATRLSLAVDNSIYQVIPQAVLFPRTTNDIVQALTLAQRDDFRNITFCPRGGGTSTNGQSLAAGIIIDCSRHMCAILELNLEECSVTVQPGVVLDQLNTFLRDYGYCFAPEISPSNRATIGGMVNTDACGLGSKLLGRTSDHVKDLTCVLMSGQVIQAGDTSADAYPWHEDIVQLIAPHTALINQKFTSAPRTLCGYNLKKIPISLNYLFCGSEGTLAVMAACKLKLTPIPKYKKLLVLKYKSFDDALRAVELTEQFQPLAIEAIDEKLVELARGDSIYFYLKEFIDGGDLAPRAINLVEFVADDENQLNETITAFCTAIETNKELTGHAFGYYIAKTPAEAKILWELRKKSVGLISKKQQGTRRPIPFIEDTAVPPEHLADYIAEFRAILDSHHLLYGMYGHVDAGCVHVRPALDMKLAADETLMRQLTEKIVTLIEKYQGVLWGEHGHGHRSEYGERFFGETLFHVVRQIKTLFDPFNQLNPGKIATPLASTAALVSLDGPLRGHFDKQITETIREEFSDSITCNGNGACFNYATADVMCPSYKVTHDRIQSPKGRATVTREWLRQLSNRKFIFDFNKTGNIFFKWAHQLHKKRDFSHEVYAAMSGCLSCKGCASQCPLNVDVPDFKAKFLAIYHQRYLRPLRDYFIASLEYTAVLQARFPRITNAILALSLMQWMMRHCFKLIDTPLISTLSLKKELEKRNVPSFNLEKLKALSKSQTEQSVILLQDTFSSFYEPHLLLKTYDFLTTLGLTVYIAPFFPSGKPVHVKGFLKKFNQIVQKNNTRLTVLSTLNIPLIGIDPSITLTYRDEYQKILGTKKFTVWLIQEWLVKYLDRLKKTTISSQPFYLQSHCTEKTMCIESEKDWQTIFTQAGLQLTPLPAGCCGMAGAYGHEAEHLANSKALFAMNWQKNIEANPETILATGYSCRSQAKRLMNKTLKHPIEVLYAYTKTT